MWDVWDSGGKELGEEVWGVVYGPAGLADSGAFRNPTANGAVGWPGASQPRAPTESVRNGLPLYGSCRPGHLAAGFAQAQCAKYRGRVAAASAMDRVAFFQVRSFLYLFMIHPIR